MKLKILSDKLIRLVFATLILSILSCGENNCQTGIARIGIVTDTHYDRVTFQSRNILAASIVDIFNSEKVDLILGLGDIYEGNYTGLGDYLNDRDIYEIPWLKAKAPVYWVLGNHDNWGISSDQYTSNNKFIHERDYTVDLKGNWRIIIYANCDGRYFSSSPDDLAWLKNALEEAKAAGKKIIIAAHVRIDQDYPGNPPSYTSGQYSAFSYNAKEQREIINSAKTNGADIKYVFHGHIHNNAKTTVDGIDYYCFKNTGSDGSAAIIDIQADDKLIITGFGAQKSYK